VGTTEETGAGAAEDEAAGAAEHFEGEG